MLIVKQKEIVRVSNCFFESVNFVMKSPELLEAELLVVDLRQGWSFLHLWPAGLCSCRTWSEEDVAAAESFS